MHLPRRVAELRVNIKRASDEILTETGKSPTAKQLALRLGVTEEEIVRAAEAGGVVSLDRPVDSGEEGMSFYDVLSDGGDAFESLERHDAVRSALKGLSEVERKIVDCRFDEELSQTETARRLGVSQMYVSRMERKILDKLRENLKKSMAE